MNKTTTPMAMDADWFPVDDEDQIQRHEELKAAFEHAIRRQRAYSYIGRVADQRRESFVLRLLAGSLTFFGLACVLAVLVG